jgi:GNAT superfamily N-acetyltransferase
MEYKVKNEINIQDFLDIRKELEWNDIPQGLVQKAIQGSMINISVYDSDICIGLGRIVGDHALKGMITDVMVRKEYQGKGVGKLVVTSLIDKLINMVNEGECFQLEASPTAGNREFYIKCGLKYKPENQDGVYLWIRK